MHWNGFESWFWGKIAFKSHLCQLLAVWPCANDLAYLKFSFLVSKMGVGDNNSTYLLGLSKDEMK